LPGGGVIWSERGGKFDGVLLAACTAGVSGLWASDVFGGRGGVSGGVCGSGRGDGAWVWDRARG